MTKKHQYPLGIAMMICSSACFSIMAGLIRYLSHVDSFTIAFFRFAIALALLGTLALTKKIKLTFTSSTLLFLRGFFGGAAVLLFYFSISTIGISKATVIVYSSPIFATIGSALFLGEKVSPKKCLVILSAFIGIYLIATSSTQSFARIGRYDLLATMGALSAGVAVVLVKKLRDTESSYSIFFAQCIVGFWLVLLPGNVVTSTIGLSGGLLLLAIGVTASAGQLMMTYSYRYLPVSTGSLIGMLVPVCNIAIGVIGFNEDISRQCIMGIIIVLASCTFLLAGKRAAYPPLTG
jgi:drug/metabolite transporter (DMT)-like permease